MVNMIELDHRFVVVGGLIVACLFYQVPFFTIATVILCGGAVYVRNRYKKGDRVSLGLSGFRIVRQTRRVGRLRTLKTPPNTIRSTASQASTPRNQTWGSNLSFGGTSPVSPCVYGSPYRGQLTSRMLQARLSRGSPQTSELGLKGVSSESPRYFQKQTTGSLGGRPDMSANKPDTSYNDICQAKYVGVGVYPTVHLEPSLPLLLSNFNSTMTKNRVTVKVAPREKSPFQKSRLENLQTTSESGMVIDALKSTRKRSLNDDVGEAIQKRQRVHAKSTSQPFLSPPAHFLPNGIDHRFNSSLCDESMLILPPHFAAENNVASKPLKMQLSKKLNVTGLDSIESSYSSSKKMAEKTLQRRRSKRKPEQDCLDMPENKISRNKMSPTVSISPSHAVLEYPNLQTDDTKSLTEAHAEDGILANPKTPNTSDNPRSHSSLDLKAHSSPTLGSRSSSSMYIPSYIPTLDDYLQDKILNEQRLLKMLSAIAGTGCPNEERDTTALQIADMKESSKVSLITPSDSQLSTSLVVSASSTAPMFSFGKTVLTDSATPALTKSTSLPSEDSVADVSQSKLTGLPLTNLTTTVPLPVLPQAPSTSIFTPSLSLNVTNPSICNATPSSTLSLVSSLSVPTTSILPVVTATSMISNAPTVSSPFSSSLAMSTPAAINPLITPISSSPSLFSFGQTTIGTTSAMNSFTTTEPAVPFSSTASMNLSFGNAVSTALNTSTVAAVTNPLFSVGSSTSKSPLPAFSVGAGSNSLGLSAPSTISTFSMASPTTNVPSLFNIPSLTQAAGTTSTGFQFGAFGSQATSPLNDKAMKENTTSGMMLTTANPSSSMSPFGVMTSNNNVTTTSSAPSLFSAVGLKPLMTNNITSNSPFQQAHNSVNPNSQTASGGFAFGLTQDESAMKNTGGLFAAPNTSQVVNPFVTSQSLAFGAPSNSQTPSFGNSTAGTSLVGVSTGGSSALSTGTPFAFGNGSAAFAPKSFTAGHLGTGDGPSSTNSSGFGVNVSLPTNNAAFGANNTTFGNKNASFGSNNASFGANSAGFGTTNTGFGASLGFGTNNASSGASNASNAAFGTSNINNAAFGTSIAGSAGFGASNAANTAFGTGNAGNAAFGASNSGNVGFGASNSGNVGFGASNSGSIGFGASNSGNVGFGASTSGNVGFGASNSGNATFGASNANNAAFGTSNTGFGAINANNALFGASNTNNAVFGASNSGISGFGASNAGSGGFGVSNPSTGFGATTINGSLPPSYSSSAGNIVTTFGGNTKPSSAGGFAFGNSVAPATTVFGSSSAVSPNTSTSFQFNGSSLNQSNTNFFASPSNNNDNNNTSLGSPFSFKGQAPQVASNQGFNFNPAAQPSFNFGNAATAPSTASMFSIGTGNQASRLGKASTRSRSNR